MTWRQGSNTVSYGGRRAKPPSHMAVRGSANGLRERLACQWARDTYRRATRRFTRRYCLGGATVVPHGGSLEALYATRYHSHSPPLTSHSSLFGPILKQQTHVSFLYLVVEIIPELVQKFYKFLEILGFSLEIDKNTYISLETT